MLKKLILASILGASSLALVACGGDSAEKTGVTECDELFAISSKYMDQVPEAQKKFVEDSFNQLKQLAKTAPEQAKVACKAALDQTPASLR